MPYMFNTKELAEAYKNFDGPVVVAKMAKPRPLEKTFRNNKYSVFNMGRLASNLGSRGFAGTSDNIAA
jgi:hypothetical protein